MTPRPAALPPALAAACVLGVVGVGFVAESPPPAGPEGCYDVEVGLWLATTDREVTRPRLPPDRARDSTAFVLPPRLLLSARPLDVGGAEGWMSAAAPEGALPSGHRYQAWRPSPDGGVLLWFATDRAGLQGSLDPADGAFRGRARTFYVEEEGAQRYERDVILRPVDCTTDPPIAADALQPLPREIELAGGARLRLGGTPPEGLRTSRRPSGASGVAARTVGLFAGSDSVAYRVGESDGRIGVVQLIFPAPAAAGVLIERITDRYGEPDPNTAVPGAWWHNRVTEVSVITEADGGYRVLLQDPRSW